MAGIRDRFSVCNLNLNQKGSALIITLLIVTILVALTVEFAYDVYIDTSALSNWSNAQKASLTARSGQTLAARYLTEVKNYSYTSIKAIEMPIEKDLGPGSGLIIRIEEENSKLNINDIIDDHGMIVDDAFLPLKKLFDYLDINPDIPLIIADWLDTDSEPRLAGSEDAAKNNDLWCVDELKSIGGIDKEIFNSISPFITVHGNGQVNINTAELPVLVSLHPDMTEDLAKRIIDYRESTPFEDKSYIQRVSGLQTIGMVLKRVTVKGSSFRVVSIAKSNEIKRIIESVMDTSMKIEFWREG
jgi:general secretion pathway protein K